MGVPDVSADRRAVRPGGLEVGVFVPQGWKLEYTGWSATDAWERSVELARLAEALGYDHLWVYDHVETVPAPPADPRVRGLHPAGRAVAADVDGCGWVSW